MSERDEFSAETRNRRKDGKSGMGFGFCGSIGLIGLISRVFARIFSVTGLNDRIICRIESPSVGEKKMHIYAVGLLHRSSVGN